MVITKSHNKNKLSSILRGLDLITATLLLNVQVTITRVFLQSGGVFSISFAEMEQEHVFIADLRIV
ncbi:hypothetical protein MNQ98_16285 [Paenibacillus sp. N3/727]|uniref:hypothetical protein n=1 Tax=Paenibacillus sp. N3/727 TaxID=2925845 RepID=UPI001F53B44E|nr:hypothetical protein [Paenibacillus sp. N3/727]UNK16094.1 hypothetical protein MNQ98_16285 [Paenibacillus sp. N3/727]